MQVNKFGFRREVLIIVYKVTMFDIHFFVFISTGVFIWLLYTLLMTEIDK